MFICYNAKGLERVSGYYQIAICSLFDLLTHILESKNTIHNIFRLCVLLEKTRVNHRDSIVTVSTIKTSSKCLFRCLMLSCLRLISKKVRMWRDRGWAVEEI